MRCLPVVLPTLHVISGNHSMRSPIACSSINSPCDRILCSNTEVRYGAIDLVGKKKGILQKRIRSPISGCFVLIGSRGRKIVYNSSSFLNKSVTFWIYLTRPVNSFKTLKLIKSTFHHTKNILLRQKKSEIFSYPRNRQNQYFFLLASSFTPKGSCQFLKCGSAINNSAGRVLIWTILAKKPKFDC